MKKKLQSLLKSEGLRQSAVFTLANFGAYGISATAILLITRGLGPSGFGEFWLGLACVNILGKLETFGLPLAIQKLTGKLHGQPRAVHHVFQQSTLFFLVSLCAGTALGFAAAPFLNAFLNISQPQLLYWAVLCAGVSATYEHFSAYFQVRQNFKVAAIMLASQAFSKLAIAIVFLLTGLPSGTLLFGIFYLMPVVSIVYAYVMLPEKQALLPEAIDQQVIENIRRIIPHAAFMAIGMAIIEYIDIFILRKYTSATETGLFAGMSQYALAITLIAQAIGTVLNARVARYHDWSHLSLYLRKIPFLYMMLAGGFIIFIPLAYPLVKIILGESYVGAVPVLIGLVTAAVLYAATLPMAAMLLLDEERSSYFSVTTVLMLVIQVGGGLLLIPQYGLLAAAGVRTVSRATIFIYTVFAVVSLFRRKYSTVRIKPS